jgi:hypothetical protein
VSGDRLAHVATTFMDLGQGLQPVGVPSSSDWTATELTPWSRDEALRRELVAVGDRELECVVDTAGDTTTWYAVAGDLVVYPDVVRVTTTGRTTYELVSIEAPPPAALAPR